MKKSCVLSLVAVALVLSAGMAFGDDDDSGAPRRFQANLSGAQEVTEQAPGFVETDASGSAKARFDKALTRVRVELDVSDTQGDLTNAHFHCGRPGENGPVAFGIVSPGPLEFEDGEVEGRLTNADFTGADCVPTIGRPVNNVAALAFAMHEGLIYLNVHTSEHPSGEIRGQMHEEDDD